MSRIIVDYVWLYNNELMFKTSIVKIDARRYPDISSYIGETPRLLKDNDLEKIPDSYFYSNDKKLILLPVKIYESPFSENRYILLCEVFSDGETPHKTNKRFHLKHHKSCKKIRIKQTIFCSENEIDYNSYIDKNIQNNHSHINIIEKYIEYCLKVNIKLSDIYMSDDSSWIYEFKSNSIVTNIDDLIISMYILTILSKKNKTNFNYSDTIIFIDDNSVGNKLFDLNFYDIINLL